MKVLIVYATKNGVSRRVLPPIFTSPPPGSEKRDTTGIDMRGFEEPVPSKIESFIAF